VVSPWSCSMPAIGESLRHFIAQTEEAGSKASPAEGLPVAVTTARRYVMAMISYAASGPICSFCQRPRAEVLSLVDGGTVRICSDSQPSPPNRSSAARSVSGSPSVAALCSMLANGKLKAPASDYQGRRRRRFAVIPLTAARMRLRWPPSLASFPMRSSRACKALIQPFAASGFAFSLQRFASDPSKSASQGRTTRFAISSSVTRRWAPWCPTLTENGAPDAIRTSTPKMPSAAHRSLANERANRP
jgi:hypothetical protein